MTKLYYYVSVLAGIGIVGLVFCLSLMSSGIREIAPLTTIRGAPFPWQRESYIITEALAHTDVFLQEPVAGKELLITLNVIPRDTKALTVGVRHNDFWLSYEPISVFSSTNTQDTHKPITAAVRIPLTDKLQDSDRSIDLMFFADTTPAEIINRQSAVLNTPIADNTNWELISVSASVVPTYASGEEWKDYIRSIIYMERPK